MNKLGWLRAWGLLGFIVFLFNASPIHAIESKEEACARAARALVSAQALRQTPQSWTDVEKVEFLSRLKAAKRIVFLFDHDGTFKEHEANSEAVRPTPDELKLIEDLADHVKIDFVFITGRPMDWMLERYAQIDSLYVSANHGVVNRPSYSGEVNTLEGVPFDFEEADVLLNAFVEKHPLARIEYKVGRVLHWKAYGIEGVETLNQVTHEARELLEHLRWRFKGRPVDLSKWSDNGAYFEILPSDPIGASRALVGKEAAGERILEELLGVSADRFHDPDELIVFAAGDENSDNPILAMVNRLRLQFASTAGMQYISLKVGENSLAESDAQFWVPHPADLRQLLLEILQEI